MTPTTLVVNFLVVFSVFWAGWFMHRWFIRRRTRSEKRDGIRYCEICNLQLAKSACRTHDGKWRCEAHKRT